MNKTKLAAVAAAIVLLAAAAAVLVFGSITVVPTGQIGIVISGGKSTQKVLEPGTHFVKPFVDKVELADSRSKKLTIEEEMLSADDQTIGCKINMQYHLESERYASLYEQFGADYEQLLIESEAVAALENEIEKYDSSCIKDSHDKIEESIGKMLEFEFEEYSVVIDKLSLSQFDLSEVETTTQTTAQVIASSGKVEYDSYGIALPDYYAGYSPYGSYRNGYCSVKSAHVLRWPSPDAPKREADSIYEGDAVTVYGIVGGYYYIGTDSGKSEDLMGYVKTEYITLGTPPAVQDKSGFATQGVVDVQSANIRSTPSKVSSSNVTDRLYKGDPFTIVDFDGYWYYISYGEGKHGYISYKMVSVW